MAWQINRRTFYRRRNKSRLTIKLLDLPSMNDYGNEMIMVEAEGRRQRYLFRLKITTKAQSAS
jgi:hypothetical protein